jgi:hypothetical protein
MAEEIHNRSSDSKGPALFAIRELVYCQGSVHFDGGAPEAWWEAHAIHFGNVALSEACEVIMSTSEERRGGNGRRYSDTSEMGLNIDTPTQ